MTDVDLELFDADPSTGDEGQRTGEPEGSSTEPGVGESGDGSPTSAGDGLDISFLPQEARDALAQIDPEVRSVLAEQMRKQRDDTRRDAGKKWEEAAAMRREAKSQLEAMQTIVDRLNGGHEQKTEPDVPSSLADIDIDAPGGEDMLVKFLANRLGLDKRDPKKEIESAISAHPVIRKAQLRQAAQVARASLDKPIDDGVWKAITDHWTQSKADPLAATPETLYAELRSLAAVAGLSVSAAPKAPVSANAPSPSGNFSAGTRKLKPHEREKRHMTDEEIFADTDIGGSLEDLKRDLAGLRGRG